MCVSLKIFVLYVFLAGNKVGLVMGSKSVRTVYTFFLASYRSAGVDIFLLPCTIASHWLEDFAKCISTGGRRK